MAHERDSEVDRRAFLQSLVAVAAAVPLSGVRWTAGHAAKRSTWHEDPWTGGGWGWTQPDELVWMFPAMRQPDGRVHFAGEHTALHAAWMNGALESAERVVDEVLAAARSAGGRS